MKSRRINSERVEFIVGFLFLLTAFIVSLYYDGDKNSILELIPHHLGRPLTAYILPIVHGTMALWCFFLIFKPSIRSQVIMLFIESFITILTNTEMLGIFFFYAAVAISQISQAFNPKEHIKIATITIIHFLCILGIYPHGWAKVFLALGTSCFYMVFMFWIYHLLRVKFSSFLQKAVYENSVIKEEPGQIVNLKDYGLTERQIAITKDYVANKTAYKELAEKYITSLSSIKKDFSIVFQKLGVSDIHEMSVLLQQYQLN